LAAPQNAAFIVRPHTWSRAVTHGAEKNPLTKKKTKKKDRPVLRWFTDMRESCDTFGLDPGAQQPQ